MRILGIESSCDDTSVALLDIQNDIPTILAEKTASQIEVHKKYGGVVPEIAGRCHAENILPVIEEVMKGQEKPDAIAVTSGPGLITGLLVGVEAAKALSYLLDIPLVRTNHMEGHIHSVEIRNPEFGIRNSIEFPALCLIVSGGHTELTMMYNHGEYKKIGKTVDDAAGECFDKVAKLVGFEYPGGPKISKFAAEGNPAAIHFPRPMMHDDNFNFSFSGLKTAALYWLRDHADSPSTPSPLNATRLPDFCASFEQAIIDVLIHKTVRAAKQYQPKTIILGGGVSANKKLRKTLEDAATTLGCKVLVPELKYCMDNGAMIAMAGYYHALKGEYTSWRDVAADPNWELGE